MQRAARGNGPRVVEAGRVVVCLLAVVMAAAACADDAADRGSPFPATVRVRADHTYLRAGPGNDS